MKNIAWFKKLTEQRVLSKETLKEITGIVCREATDDGKEVSGFYIKNAIETFLIYSCDVLGLERKAFYFTKGQLNDVLSEMGLDVITRNSGAYDKELFSVKNFDVAHFNRSLVGVIAELCAGSVEGKSEIDSVELSGEKVCLHYIFKEVNESLETRYETLRNIFGMLYSNGLIDALTVKNDTVLFSIYKPSDLYEAWYINEVFIDKAYADGVIEALLEKEVVTQ